MADRAIVDISRESFRQATRVTYLRRFDPFRVRPDGVIAIRRLMFRQYGPVSNLTSCRLQSRLVARAEKANSSINTTNELRPTQEASPAGAATQIEEPDLAPLYESMVATPALCASSPFRMFLRFPSDFLSRSNLVHLVVMRLSSVGTQDDGRYYVRKRVARDARAAARVAWGSTGSVVRAASSAASTDVSCMRVWAVDVLTTGNDFVGHPCCLLLTCDSVFLGAFYPSNGRKQSRRPVILSVRRSRILL
jgi:hypothetical protein